MKKIMCITVSAIIVLSLNIFVSAQDFTDNYGKPGGAICIDDHSIVLDNTSFSGNYASGDGGAIHFDGGLVDTSFVNNHSNENGGAICLDGNPVNPGNTSFVNTHSSENGGAIYFDGNH